MHPFFVVDGSAELSTGLSPFVVRPLPFVVSLSNHERSADTINTLRQASFGKLRMNGEYRNILRQAQDERVISICGGLVAVRGEAVAVRGELVEP